MLRHRQFARFITGATVASIGQFLGGLATPFYMNELTDSNTWVGASGFAGLAPAVIMTPLAGILSDRLSRKVLLTSAYGLQTIVTAIILVTYLFDALTPGRIIVLMMVAGSIAGFMFAPIQSMAPTLVPEEDLVRGVQLLSIAFTVGRALGPGIGALVLTFAGPGLAWTIATGCFAAATVALFLTQPGPQPAVAEPKSFVADFRSGLRYIAERPPMKLAVRAAFVVGVFGASWAFSLVASVADDGFGVGGGGLGALATMIGVGSVAASIFIGRGGGDVRRSLMETIALTLYGLGVLVAAATDWFALGLVGYLVIGVAHMWHNVSLSTSLQVQVDEEHRGRVMSVFLVAILGGLPIGAILGGVLADQVHIRIVMAVFGFAIIGFTAVAYVTNDGLRGLDDNKSVTRTHE